MQFVAVFQLLWLYQTAAAVLYVDVNSANPTPPYTNWASAATNIQDAVNLASTGDQILVTNGIYQYGGAFYSGSNRVYIAKAIIVQSVNGPAATIIEGEQGPPTVRCVCLVSGSMLQGFSLTNGCASSSGVYGGGVYCRAVGIGIPSAVVSNCIITGNRSYLIGGGAYMGLLKNCVLIGNVAGDSGSGGFTGGGASSSTLYDCSVISNAVIGAGSGMGGGLYSCTASNCLIANNSSADLGGGACQGSLVNCRLFNNTAGILNSSSSAGGGGAYATSLTDCLVVSNCVIGGITVSGVGCGFGCSLFNCTVVDNSVLSAFGMAGGVYNGTVFNSIVYNNTASNYPNYYGGLHYSCTIPLPASGDNNFTNAPLFVDPAGGDFHLGPNSPCINSGNNDQVVGAYDLDGNPRIVGGTVDAGAYEYQTPSSILSYAWAQEFNLPTGGSADYLDLDGTGMPNWQKCTAGLNPTNPASVLAMLPLTTTNIALGVTVTWQSVNNRTYYLLRATNLAIQPAYLIIQSNLLGQTGTTSYLDRTATNGGPYFYRVRIQ